MSTETKYPSFNPELWGGIECTINRVDNIYRHQLANAGHYLNEEGIKQFAKLGITKLRFPVLWETHLAGKNGQIDWQLTTARLQNIRNNNIIPIAGLVHHGSGPEYTNLLDTAFPEKLAAYARQVAIQFPWLEYYTPVNEPLTTARFSGLYGFWYPHHQNEKSFVLMLLNQVKGIILSMQEIRKINPAAKLVQTEDLCKIHSTPKLAYQARFENERRWLTYDLLCGRFTPVHVLWNHFLSLGITEDQLLFFAASSCPPDIMGFNYYVTSERYLDENIENYAPGQHGGNGLHRYADTDAARVNKRCGLEMLLKEAWERYGLPMAVTECHLNCTREEQLRWFSETWDVCCVLNRQGIPVKAVTAWSLVGSYDWDSLLLQQNGHYEQGVFDTSSGYLRPTLLAKMIHTLASGHELEHPLLENKGWWHTLEESTSSVREIAPLLIIDYDESTAKNFERVCNERRIAVQQCSPRTFMAESSRPWAVLITISDWTDECAAVYEAAQKYCLRHEILLLLVMSSLQCIPEENHLFIQHNGTGGMKFAHDAIDLLIDEEKGIWRYDEQGARRISLEEPALLY